jgi:CDP-paratose 2-epimerase
MKCCVTGRPYTVFGYQGKQVRDNIHSADLVRAFEQVARAPKVAAVYNIGGGREVNCSMLEAIAKCEALVQRPLTWKYQPASRVGDHIWYISDLNAFRSDYPEWSLQYSLDAILEEIFEAHRERAGAA